MLPDAIVYWHWLAFGALIGAVEILVPVVFFLWLGVAAIATGLVLLVFPALSWTVQLLLFAVLSVVAVYAGRRFFRATDDEPTDHPDLNRRAHRLVGQRFSLDEATLDERGRLKVGDVIWRIVPVAGDLPAGPDETDEHTSELKSLMTT